ncbi:MAG TPA: secretion system protein, partial [Pseudonocardiaceae bacterium]|nr:secretion system protein [Pseudonocardiaceae bacterium]
MIMVLAVACGAALGAGVWALLVWLLPPRPSLAGALTVTRPAPPREPTPSPRSGGGAAQRGAPAVRLLMRLGLPSPARRRDLQVLGRTPETFLAQKVALALAGLVAPSLA